MRRRAATDEHGINARLMQRPGECEMRLRSAAARLSWLRRAGIVNATARRWTVVDNGLFRPGPQLKRNCTLRQVETAELRGNIHPTVKPTNLMRWLVRLVTPAGGTVLDPFLGSGSTGRAAVLEGMRFIGIEKDTEHGYVAIAEARIADAIRERDEELRDRAHAQVDLFAAEVPA